MDFLRCIEEVSDYTVSKGTTCVDLPVMAKGLVTMCRSTACMLVKV